MTNLAPGMLWLYLQNAIILTIPASLILLAWYRFAVSRGMRLSSGLETSEEDLSNRTQSGTGKLFNVHARPPEQADSFSESHVQRRLATIYSASGILAALIPTGIFFLAPDMEFTALRGFTVWYCNSWPIIPTVFVLLVQPLRRSLIAFLIYAFMGCVIVFLWSSFRRYGLGYNDISPLTNTLSLLQYLGLQAWLPFLLILITGNRRLRSISPLVLAALLVFSFSAIGVNQVLIRSMDIEFLRVAALDLVGANMGYWLFMIASLPVGFLCWQGLQWLATQYNRKEFSDMQLLVDSWWLIVVFYLTAMSASNWGWNALWTFAAFFVYRIGVFTGTRLWVVDPVPASSNRLLLLRVFGHQHRTERLFDIIAQRWRLTGSINMIAGIDLALRTIDPGDFITFLGGKLKRQFVGSNHDLEEKLSTLDNRCDPDGRYRINEFFCNDNTWRTSLKALLNYSDVVLMDLRGFSGSNAGCQFEIEQLARSGMLKRTLVLLDETSDITQLERTLEQTQEYLNTQPARFNLPQSDERKSAVTSEILNTLRSLMV